MLRLFPLSIFYLIFLCASPLLAQVPPPPPDTSQSAAQGPPLVTTGPANWAQAVTAIAVAVTAVASILGPIITRIVSKRDSDKISGDVTEVKETLKDNTEKAARERAEVASILKEHTELLRKAEAANDGVMENLLANAARMSRREADRYPDDPALKAEAERDEMALKIHREKHESLKSMSASQLREVIASEGLGPASVQG